MTTQRSTRTSPPQQRDREQPEREQPEPGRRRRGPPPRRLRLGDHAADRVAATSARRPGTDPRRLRRRTRRRARPRHGQATGRGPLHRHRLHGGRGAAPPHERREVGPTSSCPPAPPGPPRPRQHRARAARRVADHRPVELPDAAPARAAGGRARRRATASWSSRPSSCPAHLGAARPAAAPVPRPRRGRRRRGRPRRDDRAARPALRPHLLHRLDDRRAGSSPQAAAKHLTPTVLELGGKSPGHRRRRRRPRRRRARIVWGKCLNAGQTCIAPDYVLVAERRTDELVERLVAAIGRFYGNDPARSPDLGRIVNDRHLDRLTGLLADHGGTVAVRRRGRHATRELAPTVVVDPDPDQPPHAGGDLRPDPARPHRRRPRRGDRLRQRPARSRSPSTCSPTTTRPSTTIIDRTSSGGVCVNHVDVPHRTARPAFGGVGDSGWGRYHGRAGFDALSNLKPVYRRPVRPELSFIYPPYTRWKSRPAVTMNGGARRRPVDTIEVTTSQGDGA